jgi:hypothetical protein
MQDPDNGFQTHQRTHSYTTRHTMSEVPSDSTDNRLTTPPTLYNNHKSNSQITNNTTKSPYGSPAPKSVAFELLFPDSPQFRARLPMRVQIFPHDTTESIVTTVKNFYGLYAGPGGAKGVSFEDEQGNTLIARYENLRNNMTVYVRVIEEASTTPDAYGPPSYHSASPVVHHNYYSVDPHSMPPPQPAQALNYGQPPSRPASRTSIKRSDSPNGRGRRSVSASGNAQMGKKSAPRSGYKSRGSSTHGSFADIYNDNMNGYSSGDGAGSVSSRTKSEHLGNTEISLDNIVEGGRRKRAKFESSVSNNTQLSLQQITAQMLRHSIRNSLCLPLLKCLLQLRTLRYHQLDEWSIKGQHFHCHTPRRTRSRILMFCSLHNHIIMALVNRDYTQRLPLTGGAPGVRRTLSQDCPLLRHQMDITQASYLHQILP